MFFFLFSSSLQVTITERHYDNVRNLTRFTLFRQLRKLGQPNRRTLDDEAIPFDANAYYYYDRNLIGKEIFSYSLICQYHVVCTHKRRITASFSGIRLSLVFFQLCRSAYCKLRYLMLRLLITSTTLALDIFMRISYRESSKRQADFRMIIYCIRIRNKLRSRSLFPSQDPSTMLQETVRKAGGHQM